MDLPSLLLQFEKSFHKDHKWIYPVSSCHWKSLNTKITNGFTKSPFTIGKVLSQRSQMDIPSFLLPLKKSCHKDHKWIYPVSSYHWKSLVTKITNGYTQSPPTMGKSCHKDHKWISPVSSYHGKVLSQRSQMDLPSLLLQFEKSCHSHIRATLKNALKVELGSGSIVTLQSGSLLTSIYLHLPSIFPIKRVRGPSVLMRAWIALLCKSAQHHLYCSAKRVWSCRCQWLYAFPYVHFKSKWHVDL